MNLKEMNHKKSENDRLEGQSGPFSTSDHCHPTAFTVPIVPVCICSAAANLRSDTNSCAYLDGLLNCCYQDESHRHALEKEPWVSLHR